jgi:hypothetical protein
MLGAALEVSVAENLEVDEANANHEKPETEQSREGVEPQSCIFVGSAGWHVSSQFSVLGSQSKLRLLLRTKN